MSDNKAENSEPQIQDSREPRSLEPISLEPIRVPLILASGSPRRAELLASIGLPFTTVVTDADESRHAGESPHDYVWRLSEDKARLGFRRGSVSIGSDTIVLKDDEILGKPSGPGAGRTMLKSLSGRAHEVFTGVSAFDGTRFATCVVVSSVWFKRLTNNEIDYYLATGEGNDKAGSYGIQGIGGILVERIEGSFSGVMGLPVQQTEAMLEALNIDTWGIRNRWLKNS